MIRYHGLCAEGSRYNFYFYRDSLYNFHSCARVTSATGMWDTTGTGMARVPSLHNTKFVVSLHTKKETALNDPVWQGLVELWQGRRRPPSKGTLLAPDSTPTRIQALRTFACPGQYPATPACSGPRPDSELSPPDFTEHQRTSLSISFGHCGKRPAFRASPESPFRASRLPYLLKTCFSSCTSPTSCKTSQSKVSSKSRLFSL